MLEKYSSPEKVAAVEGIAFWKSSRSKTAALQKKKVIRNIAFLKNQLFPKGWCCAELLLWKRSFLDIFILNSSSENIAAPKSNCHKELPILKKWLLCRSFVPKKSYSEKNDSCEKKTVLKKEKKAAVLKK